MTAIVAWFEAVVSSIPLPLLEVWGRFSYLVGFRRRSGGPDYLYGPKAADGNSYKAGLAWLRLWLHLERGSRQVPE